MANSNEYIANLIQEIESLKQKLKPLEDGMGHIRDLRFNEPWRGATQEHAEMLKRATARIQAVVDKERDA